MLYKKKKRKKKKSGGLTPEAAAPKREAIREAVASDIEAENWGDAADTTEENAAMLGDPISFKEAAEYRLNQAEADRDIDAANAAIETANVALDILHFYDAVASGDAESNWLPIAASDAGSEIIDVEDIISRAEDLIEEIESEQESDGFSEGSSEPGAKAKRKREPKPGIALIALGSAFTAVGAAGLSMVAAGSAISAQKQREVEGLVLPDNQAQVEELDDEGARANLIAYVGAGIAVAGVAVGIPLIVVGVRKRKQAKNPPASARVQVVPAVSRRFGGVALQGRF